MKLPVLFTNIVSANPGKAASSVYGATTMSPLYLRRVARSLRAILVVDTAAVRWVVLQESDTVGYEGRMGVQMWETDTITNDWDCDPMKRYRRFDIEVCNPENKTVQTLGSIRAIYSCSRYHTVAAYDHDVPVVIRKLVAKERLKNKRLFVFAGMAI